MTKVGKTYGEKFIERTIERSLAVKMDLSDIDFQKQMIKVARDIAVAEEVDFFHSEERIIKDLYIVILWYI